MNVNDETNGRSGSFEWLIILGSILLGLAAVGVVLAFLLLSV